MSNRLAEYFVVCSIIVLISVVSFIALGGLLAETRDSRRIADIATLRTALEFYHIDHGSYPQTGWVNSGSASWDTLGEALTQYLVEMPRDPINDTGERVERTGAFNYSYYTVGKNDSEGEKDDYLLVFRLEKPDRATLHQKADSGLRTERGIRTFLELTGVDGIYAMSAP